MMYFDILGLMGLVIAVFGFFAFGKTQRKVIFIISLSVLLLYSILRPVYILTLLLLALLLILLYNTFIRNDKKTSIKLLEMSPSDDTIKDFLSTYKKDIYSIFPFFELKEGQRCFLVMKGANLVGIFIYTVYGNVLTVEVDYTKPIYRDLDIGNYIYNKNPGYFKKLGVNTIISKSFHKGYSKTLEKLGFKVKYLDSQQFYEKKLD